MPGNCFLCAACLSGETAEFPCPRGRKCSIVWKPTNKKRSISVCVGLAGIKGTRRCHALLAKSLYWTAAIADAGQTLGKDAAFGIMLCIKVCRAWWRKAVADDAMSTSRSDDDNVPVSPPPLSSSARSPGVEPNTRAPQLRAVNPPPAPRRHRRHRVSKVELALETKRIRTDPPPPLPPNASSSPWLALATGYMQMQAEMAQTAALRARLAERERMHALGYTKEQMDHALTVGLSEAAVPGAGASR
ncbi:hypothetical protein AMAG_15417 [Allomyces macrogynus ATCC 38327]|uniref:Uncharacterized protein n=1 Tax=Allomyces macrogynus (strain ATCC 38327) TaxID=578462 RepID=A0A0L0T7E7_ALLM3|nr:hypothetical protein AMAG_15417 [Allomyces macrogynus ATCC 38327]|eukprot:KNE70660.1 hypothetical protein AMAG_15417 [Allomyces macrogynus ATCC 38327]